MAFEKFFPTDNTGRGALLNEYNGEFSIIQAWKPAEGTVRPNWVFPQKKDGKPSEKSLPQKVGLGPRHKCIEILEQMLFALKNEDEPFF